MKAHLHLLGIVAALLGSACSGHLEVEGPDGPTGMARAGACGADGADAPYGTVAELTEQVVGAWVRCDGPPQVEGEELGVEFAEGRVLYPLERAPDGGAVRVPPAVGVGPESWSALLDARGRPRLVLMWASSPSKSRSSLVIDGPSFFDGAQQMFLPIAQVGATYVRLQR